MNLKILSCHRPSFFQLVANSGSKLSTNIDALEETFSNKKNSADKRTRALLLLFIYSTNKKKGVARCLQKLYLEQNPSPLNKKIFKDEYLELVSAAKQYLKKIIKKNASAPLVQGRAILLLMLLSNNTNKTLNKLLNKALAKKSESVMRVLGVSPYALLYDEQIAYLNQRGSALPALKE